MSNKTKLSEESNNAEVDDLTRQFEKSLFTDSGQNSQEQENTSLNENGSNTESDDDDGANEKAEEEADLENLKKIEDTLTDSEKQSRREEALVFKSKGNDEFKNQLYLESITSYTKGLSICPLKFANDRSVLYANRAASKMKIDRNKSAIEDCTLSIELNKDYVKAYLRRAKLYEDTDKLEDSLEDYKKILELDPNNHESLSANQRLPPLIHERNEKLKTEMLGKLKDLGNMILRPFGLSTENFNLQQDPNSGGYSVNFKQ